MSKKNSHEKISYEELMCNNSVVTKIPLSLDNEYSRQHQIKLIRYTAQLKLLLNTPPQTCDHGTTENVCTDITDNYLWTIGELVNGMYELNQQLKQRHHLVNQSISESDLKR